MADESEPTERIEMMEVVRRQQQPAPPPPPPSQRGAVAVRPAAVAFESPHQQAGAQQTPNGVARRRTVNGQPAQRGVAIEANTSSADEDHNEENEDAEVEELCFDEGSLGRSPLRHVLHAKQPLFVPNKSQVLLYFSATDTLNVARQGGELQVLDSAMFPLFDVWCAPNGWLAGAANGDSAPPGSWVIEAYGRRVLTLVEMTRRRGWCGKKEGGTPLAVKDWNQDTLGHLIPGEPIHIQNTDQQTIAKCVLSSGSAGDSTEIWEVLLANDDRPVARLAGAQLSFRRHLGFQLKLLLLATLIRIAGQSTAKPVCWPFLGSYDV